jgi:hypothetical protein
LVLAAVAVRKGLKMQVDSLDELKSAFAAWRKSKKYARETIPEELLARARRAAKAHGMAAVVRVTRLERARLLRSTRMPTSRKPQSAESKKQQGVPMALPRFSRLELGAPLVAGARPIAEVETGTGVKLSVFEETPAMMGLLSSVCGVGGVR